MEKAKTGMQGGVIAGGLSVVLISGIICCLKRKDKSTGRKAVYHVQQDQVQLQISPATKPSITENGGFINKDDCKVPMDSLTTDSLKTTKPEGNNSNEIGDIHPETETETSVVEYATVNKGFQKNPHLVQTQHRKISKRSKQHNLDKSTVKEGHNSDRTDTPDDTYNVPAPPVPSKDPSLKDDVLDNQENKDEPKRSSSLNEDPEEHVYEEAEDIFQPGSITRKEHDYENEPFGSPGCNSEPDEMEEVYEDIAQEKMDSEDPQEAKDEYDYVDAASLKLQTGGGDEEEENPYYDYVGTNITASHTGSSKAEKELERGILPSPPPPPPPPPPPTSPPPQEIDDLIEEGETVLTENELYGEIGVPPNTDLHQHVTPREGSLVSNTAEKELDKRIPPPPPTSPPPQQIDVFIEEGETILTENELYE